MSTSTEETQPVESTEGTPQLSPGQRLAAQKAAKAARKAAKRGNDADLVEAKALAQAAAASKWASSHRGLLTIVGTALVVIIGGTVLYSQHVEGVADASGSKLWDAVETANAMVRPAGSSTADYKEQTFESANERAKRAGEQYKAALATASTAEGRGVAELGAAVSQYDLGNWNAAREAFGRAMSAAPNSAFIKVEALEGIAYTYEAEKNWDKADAQYTALEAVDYPRIKDVAAYHHARILIAKGERAKAVEALKKLNERMSDASKKAREAKDETYAPLDFTEDRVESRLATLDPTAVRRSAFFGGGGGGGGAQQFSPEELQKLIEQLQAQQQGGAQ